MALSKKTLAVEDRMTHDVIGQFLPLDQLRIAVKRAGTEYGLDLAVEIAEVKAELADRQAVRIAGDAPGAGRQEVYVVQSNMGTAHFFTTYWKGIVTFGENVGINMLGGEGLVKGLIRKGLDNQREAKIAQARTFVDMVTDLVVPRAVEMVLNGEVVSEPTPVPTPAPQPAPPKLVPPQEKPKEPKVPKVPKEPKKPKEPKEPERPATQGQPAAPVDPPTPVTPPNPTPDPPKLAKKTDTLLNQLVYLTRDEAANGCVKTIKLSDGREVTVSIPAGSKANGHVDVEGQGRLDKNTGQRGTLRLSFALE